MGRSGICSPFSVSAAVAVHEEEDRAMGYRRCCVTERGNCHRKGKRGHVERKDMEQ